MVLFSGLRIFLYPITFLLSLIGQAKIVRGIRATVGAQNIATFTDYSGFDPEVGSYVGSRCQFR